MNIPPFTESNNLPSMFHLQKFFMKNAAYESIIVFVKTVSENNVLSSEPKHLLDEKLCI